MSIIIDQYGITWKKIENLDETIGHCIACAMRDEKTPSLNGWPTYHKKYKYTKKITRIIYQGDYYNLISGSDLILPVISSQFNNLYGIYIKMSSTNYDPNQEPEDDCL